MCDSKMFKIRVFCDRSFNKTNLLSKVKNVTFQFLFKDYKSCKINGYIRQCKFSNLTL